jgi:membrane protein DedA with SNARE-associated domain
LTLGPLVAAHGYWILAAGCLLEGETVVVLAGLAAHHGYLSLPAVIAVATVAATIGDQFYFWLGRWRGPWVLARWPSLVRHADRVHRLTARYHAAVIIALRFAYGLRIAGPVLIGMSGFPGLRFGVLNAIGALLWACIMALAGWWFGEAAQALLGDMKDEALWLLATLVAAGLAIWWWRTRRP